MLLHLTSSSRFEGSLNMDINEITMNMVPYPHMQYLTPSIAPLYALADVAMPPRKYACIVFIHIYCMCFCVAYMVTVFSVCTYDILYSLNMKMSIITMAEFINITLSIKFII